MEAYWTQKSFFISILQCLFWIVDRLTWDVKSEEELLRARRELAQKGKEDEKMRKKREIN